MTEFRRVTDAFWVAPQIEIADLALAKSLGFTLIVNNRPDGESPAQPRGEEIAAAAQAVGLNYLAAPVMGLPATEQVEAVRAATANAAKTLAFCRSGTRSIITWALGRAATDSRTDLVRLAADAGYDLRSVLAP